MKDEKLDYNAIINRLDVIIHLLIEQAQEKEGATRREIIGRLNELGLKDIEIAKIFCKTRGYISGEIAQHKKTKKKS